MRRAAELHWESVPMWNWQRFLAGMVWGWQGAADWAGDGETRARGWGGDCAGGQGGKEEYKVDTGHRLYIRSSERVSQS